MPSSPSPTGALQPMSCGGPDGYPLRDRVYGRRVGSGSGGGRPRRGRRGRSPPRPPPPPRVQEIQRPRSDILPIMVPDPGTSVAVLGGIEAPWPNPPPPASVG